MRARCDRGRFHWASFGEKGGGERLYRGPGMTVGLTSRFRYE